MGTYATTSSIPLLLPFALKTNTTTGDVDGVAVFSKHIDRAESLVNSYLSIRYSSQVPSGGWGLPWGLEWGNAATAIPPVLRTLSEDITCYYFIRSTYVQDGERKNQYADSYKEAVKQLEQIRDGKTPLALTSGALLSHITTGKIISSTQDYAPTFDEGSPENWTGDSEKDDDIANAK